MPVTEPRNCLNCKRLFAPDYRHRHDQFYCAKPACKKARQAASLQRWREHPENRGFWRGRWNIERVQEWRAAHPEYWKRVKKKQGAGRGVALQNAMKPVQASDYKLDNSNGVGDCVTKRVLGDLKAQDPVLIGLIAQLTGDTLQNAIHQTTTRLYEKGQAVMGQRHEISQ
ncbi:MAG: hypothetical protein Q7S40_01205 [Opitutaceae bacterium]|nr:hypothetical protein [Opitutaceae bacterium]